MSIFTPADNRVWWARPNVIISVAVTIWAGMIVMDITQVSTGREPSMPWWILTITIAGVMSLIAVFVTYGRYVLRAMEPLGQVSESIEALRGAPRRLRAIEAAGENHAIRLERMRGEVARAELEGTKAQLAAASLAGDLATQLDQVLDQNAALLAAMVALGERLGALEGKAAATAPVQREEPQKVIVLPADNVVAFEAGRTIERERGKRQNSDDQETTGGNRP